MRSLPQFLKDARFTSGQYSRIYLSSLCACIATKPPTEIQRFVIFIGYQRSGSSLVGSLLDAHPHAMIAHEEDAIRFYQAHFTRRQLVYVLIRNSKWKGSTGRWEVGIKGGHSYDMNSKYQSTYSTLKVLGDKYAPITARIFLAEDVIRSFAKKIAMPITAFHVIRHPLDTLGSQFRHIFSGRQHNQDEYEWLENVIRQYKQRLLELEWCYKILPIIL